jgi:hypothetical protein
MQRELKSSDSKFEQRNKSCSYLLWKAFFLAIGAISFVYCWNSSGLHSALILLCATPLSFISNLVAIFKLRGL